MDTWGLIITAAGIILYFVAKRRPVFLLVTGIGLGLLIGAVWAAAIVNSVIP